MGKGLGDTASLAESHNWFCAHLHKLLMCRVCMSHPPMGVKPSFWELIFWSASIYLQTQLMDFTITCLPTHNYNIIITMMQCPWPVLMGHTSRQVVCKTAVVPKNSRQLLINHILCPYYRLIKQLFVLGWRYQV